MTDISPGAPPTIPDRLGQRAARGSALTVLGQLTRIVLQVASVSVLARLLSPSDYGLVAMVLTIVGIGEIFRDFGLSSAAIQAPHLSQGQRTNLFWLNGCIGAGLTVIVFLLAPLIADLYGQPRLESIARVLSSTFLINGLATQHRADLNRELRFGRVALTDISAQILGFGVGFLLALGHAGPWSLVGQQLVQVTVTMVLVMAFAGWRPGRPRRGQGVRQFLRFGRNVVASQLFGYLGNNIDSLTIGLRFGAGPLGVYTRAFQLVMTPLNQLRSPFTTVALPVLSRLQSDAVRYGKYVVSGQLGLGYTIVPGLAFVVGAADPLVHVLLGSNWYGVISVFRLLAIAAVFQMITFVGYWVYMSRGLTANLFRYTLVTVSIKIACILIGSHWGIVGVAAGYAIAPALAWPISLWWLSRITVLPMQSLWLGALRISGCALAAAGGTWLVSDLVHGLAPLLVVFAAATATAAFYGLAAIFPPVRADLKRVFDLARKVRSR